MGGAKNWLPVVGSLKVVSAHGATTQTKMDFAYFAGTHLIYVLSKMQRTAASNIELE